MDMCPVVNTKDVSVAKNESDDQPEEENNLFSARCPVEWNEGPLLSEVGVALHDVLVQDLQHAAKLRRLLLQLRLRVFVLFQDGQRVVRGLQAVHASVNEVLVDVDLSSEEFH